MGLVYPGVPTELVCTLQDTFGVQCFIETGTYLGTSALWASKRFRSVFTIEADRKLYEAACAHLASAKNVVPICENSSSGLAQVLARINEPAIVWLDAHWSCGETFGADDQCPLLTEIRLLNEFPHEHFVIIDDARLFLRPPPSPLRVDQWPTIVDVVNALHNASVNRYIAIYHDIIVAVPKARKEALIKYVSRIPVNPPPSLWSRSRTFLGKCLGR